MHVLSLPAIYSLELTAACNNCCPGCSNVYPEERTRAPMTAEQWKKLLATFAPDAVQLRLTGGEPSLHPEFFQILTAAAAYDVRVTVFTNGRWRDPDEFVLQVKGQHRPVGLLISLHGATPGSHEAFSGVKGSFAETAKNIRLAVQNNIPVALSTILTKQSIYEIDAVVDLSRELGVTHIAFNRYLGEHLPGISPTPKDYQHAVIKIEELIKKGAPVRYGIGIPQCFANNSSGGCLAGVAYAAIDPWGNLRPCAHTPLVIGSLHETPLKELWHGSRMDFWRSGIPDECLECPAFSVCHGGCRAMPQVLSEQRDPLRCAPLKEFNPSKPERKLPADGKPRLMARIRPETFGYVLLGNGRVVPVRAEALQVIKVVNGENTFMELEKRFGQQGLNLLGELWAEGMISIE